MKGPLAGRQLTSLIRLLARRLDPDGDTYLSPFQIVGSANGPEGWKIMYDCALPMFERGILEDVVRMLRKQYPTMKLSTVIVSSVVPRTKHAQSEPRRRSDSLCDARHSADAGGSR